MPLPASSTLPSSSLLPGAGVVGGAIVVAVGQAFETDASQPIIGLGGAAGTETFDAPRMTTYPSSTLYPWDGSGSPFFIAVGQVTEADLAQFITPVKGPPPGGTNNPQAPSLTSYPSLTIYPWDLTGPTTPPPSTVTNARERPPLRLHIDATTPNGRHFRWGADDPNPVNVPSGLTFSSTMPGGFESLDLTLPRKPDVDYADLERLTTLRVLGAGGEVAGEYRLEAAPRTSGDQMAVSPSAVGWQAHLEDDRTAAEIYRDIDLNNWGEASEELRIVLADIWKFSPSSGSVVPGDVAPALAQEVEVGAWDANHKPFITNWYDANGLSIGFVEYGWRQNENLPVGADLWQWSVNLAHDSVNAGAISSGDLQAGPTSGGLTGGTPYKFASVTLLHSTAGDTTVGLHGLYWTHLGVYGNHGITRQTDGLLASDVIAHAVGRWAPLLRVEDSIAPTTFAIPHLSFPEPTTAGEIIRAADRFHLRDWAVWDDRTFHYTERGARARRWRTRMRPAQLSETGPSAERTWNGVLVSYQDVDGSTRRAGPPGSMADVTDATLQDLDPENPANQLAINRWALLEMGIVSTAAGAIQVGARFLEESRVFDSSGSATIVGTLEDDRGITRPYWQIRAGDLISFIDAADSSPRRIVRVTHDDSTRTASLDLDAPPQALDALLERLGVVLVGLGL